HPQMPAVIEIDGTSKTKGILHMLGEVNPKDVKIGMKVKAVWKFPREREGAITDIKYFKPL
ncbi:MAG: DNA-binding protein, partial [candidate division Zixibacteria bacterium]|nr:DNA-binding protein [candidate division Zixibacteria bacterium]